MSAELRGSARYLTKTGRCIFCDVIAQN
jgi:hypothetical protein